MRQGESSYALESDSEADGQFVLTESAAFVEEVKRFRRKVLADIGPHDEEAADANFDSASIVHAELGRAASLGCRLPRGREIGELDSSGDERPDRHSLGRSVGEEIVESLVRREALLDGRVDVVAELRSVVSVTDFVTEEAERVQRQAKSEAEAALEIGEGVRKAPLDRSEVSEFGIG